MKNTKLLAVLIVFLSINIFGQILKPGDGIRINFYNIQEPIKGDYFIQENGKIQLFAAQRGRYLQGNASETRD